MYVAAGSIAKLSGASTLEVRSREFLYSALFDGESGCPFKNLLISCWGRDKSVHFFPQALGKIRFIPGVRHFLSWRKTKRKQALDQEMERPPAAAWLDHRGHRCAGQSS